ncbi:MAG: aspartate kinase [Flavipsychrobacter sp.]
MLVYKFGGASIANPERMKALLPIIQEAEKPILVIVSALGKTTNALEEIVNKACKGKKQEAQALVKELEQKHLNYAAEILEGNYLTEAQKAMDVFFTELQWAVDDADANRFDYSYDQIVCIGELLSTRIFGLYLEQEEQGFDWVDVRDVIRTDDTYRDARVDYDYSKKQAENVIAPLIAKGRNVITQGFIGATSDNESITLGREGSDYSAALFAAMLNANSVTIWKDVEGLKNADPKQFSDTVKIEAISYHEVIEMAYYGAQVIHPKTIKPLQNNNIPLYVKCFLDRSLKGSVIRSEVSNLFYPPLIVLKKKQLLLQVTAKDFSFITEDKLSEIYGILHQLNIKVNLMQNQAISFIACIDHKERKLAQLLELLSKNYEVFDNEDVSLLTIRHYTHGMLADLTKGRHILLEQRTKETVQVVMK